MPSSPDAGADAPPERSEVDRLAAAWLAAWTRAARFDACCTGDVGYEDPLAPQPLAGVGALDDHAGRLLAAFPDAAVARTAPPLHRGGHACIPWRLTGTHRGEVATLPATGRRIDIHGLHYVELVDCRIRRARGFFDLYDGATQLGLLPARGGLGESALMLLRGFGLRL